MRGEETHTRGSSTLPAEIPPHARRRVFRARCHLRYHGNTSACAEKSRPINGATPHTGKYLRMRGEEFRRWWQQSFFVEIPPHARRRVCRVQVTPVVLGNTSACAEKRFEPPDRSWLGRKYLRMRGEEISRMKELPSPVDIPPHARRRGADSG